MAEMSGNDKQGYPAVGIFRALNPKERQIMEQFARDFMPPSPSWRTLCHPAAVRVWLEREAAGEVIRPDGKR